ncbi:hypothetical protein DMO24_12195, partial [Modestobacter versicolor]
MTGLPSLRPVEAVERDLLRRWPESRLEPSLDRIRALTDALGRPQDAVPVVHLTGTNGKTTTARVVDDLLRASGLRVGRCTSPHLETVRERIVVDGAPLDEERFAAAHEALQPALEQVEARHGVLSFFEVVTAMAFQAFAASNVLRRPLAMRGRRPTPRRQQPAPMPRCRRNPLLQGLRRMQR